MFGILHHTDLMIEPKLFNVSLNFEETRAAACHRVRVLPYPNSFFYRDKPLTPKKSAVQVKTEKPSLPSVWANNVNIVETGNIVETEMLDCTCFP